MLGSMGHKLGFEGIVSLNNQYILSWMGQVLWQERGQLYWLWWPLLRWSCHVLKVVVANRRCSDDLLWQYWHQTNYYGNLLPYLVVVVVVVLVVVVSVFAIFLVIDVVHLLLVVVSCALFPIAYGDYIVLIKNMKNTKSGSVESCN